MTTIQPDSLAPPAAARRGLPRWPLFLIASPAAAAVWSGWVGLGGLCGFGIVHPLPGIADGFQINTAITLPVGVEAYGAYALRAWLTPGISAQARAFARGSAIGALVLGMAGQVIYHLLAAAHATRAPWPVVMLVSCIPVATLGFGAALTHLLRVAPEPVPADAPEPVPARQLVQPHPQPVPYADGHTAPDADTGDRRDSRTAGGPQPGEVDRAAVVAELADQIRDAIEAGERWRPDYDALMARTGFRRSWCEKAVRDARTAAFRTAVPAPAIRTAAPDPGTGTGTPDPDGIARTARPVLHAVDRSAG
jgi:transposase